MGLVDVEMSIPPLRKIMTRSPKTQIDKFREKARELKADQSEDKFNATPRRVASKSNEARAVVHASDCAVHNAPAYEAGECDCGAVKAER